MSQLNPPAETSPLWRLTAATLCTGILAGLGGMLLALLLHFIQHLAFGYSPDFIISNESFLLGVSEATRSRRLAVLVLCGAVAGFGWWALYRWGKPLVSIAAAVKSDQPRMPLVSTALHALLQIITVALGSPLGREVAPREIGAVSASWLARRFSLTVRETQIMIACGAGAGLAAVYNVPLGGAVFVLEVLMGPVFGVAAYGFTRMTNRAKAQAPRDARLIIFNLLNFAFIGILAGWLPQLLGNGKGPAQLSFDNQITVVLAATVLAGKLVITWSTLRAGAQGGLLTPGLSNGALLACILGAVWNMFWPGTSLGAFAIIGAAAFLASSMKMPLTAVVLIMEFTRVDHDFLIPILFAVSGSIACFTLCSKISGEK